MSDIDQRQAHLAEHTEAQLQDVTLTLERAHAYLDYGDSQLELAQQCFASSTDALLHAEDFYRSAKRKLYLAVGLLTLACAVMILHLCWT